MLNFNPTLTFDGIAQIAAIVGGGLFAFFKVRGDLALLAQRVERVEASTERVTDTMRIVAVQDNRLLNVENDIRELRHGKGYVVG